jgi:hypothetical protein
MVRAPNPKVASVHVCRPKYIPIKGIIVTAQYTDMKTTRYGIGRRAIHPRRANMPTMARRAAIWRRVPKKASSTPYAVSAVTNSPADVDGDPASASMNPTKHRESR